MGLTKFDKVCQRLPIVAQQRHLIETGRTGDPMTQALAWFVVQRKESPQGDLIGMTCALNLEPNGERNAR